MDRQALIRYMEKRRRTEAMTDAQLESMARVNRVYSASPDCRENLDLIEREIRWRRQGVDGPFL